MGLGTGQGLAEPSASSLLGLKLVRKAVLSSGSLIGKSVRSSSLRLSIDFVFAWLWDRGLILLAFGGRLPSATCGCPLYGHMVARGVFSKESLETESASKTESPQGNVIEEVLTDIPGKWHLLSWSRYDIVVKRVDCVARLSFCPRSATELCDLGQSVKIRR